MSPSVHFAADTSASSRRGSIYAPPQKKQKMNITQTYFLAHSARGKLSKEAARPDHDLRLLVGHANMLDSLMIDLANAEQEQERWFNRSLSGAREEEDVEMVHEESIEEEPEAEYEAESDDEESEDAYITPAPVFVTSSNEVEEDSEEEEGLELTRTASRHSPPELTNDSDSDSEDDHMPPSPPTLLLDTMTEKEHQSIATTSFYETKSVSEQIEESGFYLPSRAQPTIIAAY